MEPPGNSSNYPSVCPLFSCPVKDFEYVPDSPVSCFCAAPIGVWMRLRSPSFTNFRPYISQFKAYLTSNLGIDYYQLVIPSFVWLKGPRITLLLKFFPPFRNSSNVFRADEIQHICGQFATFSIPGNDLFGPYDLLNFSLGGQYANGMFSSAL